MNLPRFVATLRRESEGETERDSRTEQKLNRNFQNQATYLTYLSTNIENRNPDNPVLPMLLLPIRATGLSELKGDGVSSKPALGLGFRA